MREKCPYSEIFWSVFSLIRTEDEEILRIQYEYGKIRARKTPNTNTFHAVVITYINLTMVGLTDVDYKHA